MQQCKSCAKARMKTRAARFVIGYVSGGRATWGAEEGKAVDAMTRTAADKKLAEMPCAGAAIFELVPVAVN